MSDDYRHLLDMVKSSPDDDVVRFVFADWLEEFQDPTWADYIRQAIEFEKMEGCLRPGDCGGVNMECSACMEQQHVDEWLCHCLHENRHRWESPFWPEFPPASVYFPVWRRGFVYEVLCDCTLWTDWGNRLRANVPLEAVEIHWHGDRKWLGRALKAAPVDGLELSLSATNLGSSSRVALRELRKHIARLKCLRVTFATGDGIELFKGMFPDVALKVEMVQGDRGRMVLNREPPF